MNNSTLKHSLLTIFLFSLCYTVFAQSNTETDQRLKIRLGFNSVDNFHRQLLVTEDSNATSGIDFGYDAELYENFQNDMYWLINDIRFVSQGVDVIDFNTVLPIGLHTQSGISTILIDEILNAPDSLGVSVYDKVTDKYHDITNNDGFSIDLAAGSYLDRFELRFFNTNEVNNSEDVEEEEEEEEDDNSSEDEETEESEETDENDENDENDEDTEQDDDENDDEEEENDEEDNDEEDNDEDTTDEPEIDVTTPGGNKIALYYINSTKTIIIENENKHEVESVYIYTLNGKLKVKYNALRKQENTTIETNNLPAGNYIIIANTAVGKLMKKVSIN